MRNLIWWVCIFLNVQCAFIKIDKDTDASKVSAQKVSSPPPLQKKRPPLDLTPSHVFGLENCGNTCFMNASLQILLHTPPIASYFAPMQLQSNIPPHEKKAQDIVHAFHQLFQAYSMQDSTPHPGEMADLLPSVISGYSNQHRTQEDAQEYISFILDIFTSHTSIPNFLRGAYRNTITHKQNKKTTYNTETFTVVQLPVPPTKHKLIDLFEILQEPEDLGTQTKKIEIFSLPENPAYLFLQLRRFNYDLASGKSTKIHTIVDIPPQFFLKAAAEKTARSFSLYGVVIHHGNSPHAGHYFAFIKKGEKWFEANDTLAIERTTAAALTEISKNGYLLFYREETH